MLKKISILILMSLLFSTLLYALCSCGDKDDINVCNRSFIVDEESFREFQSKAANYGYDGNGEAPMPESVSELTEGKTYYFVGYTRAETADESPLNYHNSTNRLKISATLDEKSIPVDTAVEIRDSFAYGKNYPSVYREDDNADTAELSITIAPDESFDEFYVFVCFDAKAEATLSFDYYVSADTEENKAASGYYEHSRLSINSYLEKKIQIDRFEAKYLDSVTYAGGRYQETDLVDYLDMKVGKEYFMVFSTAVTSLLDVSNNETVTLSFKISPLSNIIGTLDTASGGELYESVTETEKIISITFDVPEPEEGSKKYNFIIKLVPISLGNPNVNIAFAADGMSIIGDKNKTATLTINGEEKSSEGFEYQLSSDKSYYSVVGLGNTNYNSFLVPSEHEGIPVKRIKSGAFMNLSWIRTLEVSEGIEYIESGAFSNCSGLSKVILPASAEVESDAFSGCDSITSISLKLGNKKLYTVFGYSVPKVLKTVVLKNDTVICGKAFEKCYNVENITLPNTVTEIGDYAFSDCNSLIDLTLESGNESFFSQCGILYNKSTLSVVYSVKAFSGALTYPDGVLSIPGGDMTEVTSITVPSSASSFSSAVTGLAPSAAEGPSFLFSKISSFGNLTRAKITSGTSIPAFNGAQKLTSVELPSKIYSIPSNGFKNCIKLASITIPEGITAIGSEAFYGCLSLRQITVPNSVTSIGEDCFYGCKSLESVTLSENITSIAKNTFYGCESLKSVLVPELVTSLGAAAFAGCKKLTSVNIPAAMTEIPERLFANCESLSSVSVPSSIYSIGSYAFSGCKSLRSIAVPETLQYIEIMAFAESGLVSFNIPASLSLVRSDSFSKCNSLTSFTVSEGNPFYYAKYGILYTDFANHNLPEEMTGHVRIVIVPAGITGKVTLDSNLYAIRATDFADCKKMTEISIPQSVKCVEAGAFVKCDSLEFIKFVGRDLVTPFYSEGRYGQMFRVEDAYETARLLKGEKSGYHIGDPKHLKYLN